MTKPFRISCQTITFGNDQGDHFPQVLQAVAAAGYEGAEIGYRHLQRIEAAAMKDLLDKNHLTLMATHGGGNMLDSASSKGKGSYFDEMVAYLTVTGTKICMYSGLRYDNEAQFNTRFDQDLKILQRTAKACLDHGMRLYYHNHDWEFAQDGKIINAVLALNNPGVDLCVDVGWAVKGGSNVVAFLERNKQRVGVLHAKDFASGKADPKVVDIVGLGDGIVPLAGIADLFRSHGKDMWVIAEQDFASVPAEAAVAANAKYLHKVF